MDALTWTIATEVLAWWELHQYDTYPGEVNVYDEEPMMVKLARQALKEENE